MDKNFADFWRNFFMRAGEGRKPMEDFAAWMRQGFTGFEQMTSLLNKTYGLDQMTKNTEDYFLLWKKAQEDFKKSFSNYLGLLGVVPKDEHLALIRKYEDLKEQASSQKETIANLRMLVADEKKVEHNEMTGKVQDLIRQQAEQFQKVMESFVQTFRADESKVEAAGSEGPKVEAPKVEAPRQSTRKKKVPN